MRPTHSTKLRERESEREVGEKEEERETYYYITLYISESKRKTFRLADLFVC